jgi:hypothetical protein
MEFLRPQFRQMVAGACLLLWLTPAARADIFCGKCAHDSGKTRLSAAPLGNTVYMPMAGPAPTSPFTVSLAPAAAEYNPLATAHEAELAMLRHERAKAALKAEMEVSKRILDRMAASTDCASCPKPAADAEIQRQLTDLTAKINDLAGRLTAVEKLLLTHDNILKEMLEKQDFPKPQKAPGN